MSARYPGFIKLCTLDASQRKGGRMPTNDLIALEANYKQWLATRGLGLTGVAPFNYYVVENFLKSFPVNDTEIRKGIIDKSLDGGVDAFFFFANRKYVFDTPDLDPSAEYKVNIVIFQCKEGSGFSPVEMGKLVFFTADALDLSKAEAKYHEVYYTALLELIKTFKAQYNRIAGTVSSIEVDYYYVTKLDCDLPKAGDPIDNYRERFEKEVGNYFPKAARRVHFINAPKLLEQAQARKVKTKRLNYSSAITSDEGWMGLVPLRELYSFLKDEHGNFTEEMLEENVRGFLQDTTVNDGITKTLDGQGKGGAEFWLLNNGITILAEELRPGGMTTVLISDPQIVNGLQTSRCVFDYYKKIGGGNDADKRRVIIRVIETKNEAIRDDIIKATNSQNRMPPEALRATDEIHRGIEGLFGNYSLFYDRRKGYYKDQRKPAAQIISVRDVLQATLAVALQRPDDARARPADYLKEEPKYQEVFGGKLNLMVYLRCVQLIRRVEAVIPKNIPDFKNHALNLLFYAALCVTCRAIKNAHVPPMDLVKWDLQTLTDDMIEAAYETVYAEYVAHGGDDKAAKGPTLKETLLKNLKKEIHG